MKPLKKKQPGGSVMAMFKSDSIFHSQRYPGDVSLRMPFFSRRIAEEKRDLRLPAGQRSGQWLERGWRRARGMRKTVRQ